MILFAELTTLLFFLICIAHAVATRGREGAWFFSSLLALGLARENFVALYKYLYEFAPLTIMLGVAPLIGSIIWGYSIYITVVWAEEITGEKLSAQPPSTRFLGLSALFMIGLACFYEPFLKLVGMARWESGTWLVYDIPPIAFVGYASLTILFLISWCWARRSSATNGTSNSRRRLALLAITLIPIALGHAVGLQALKTWWGW